jgi:hypothetical protein
MFQEVAEYVGHTKEKISYRDVNVLFRERVIDTKVTALL